MNQHVFVHNSKKILATNIYMIELKLILRSHAFARQSKDY